mmetsp:Transcript_16666/g.39197  ORF Transcript_16666/g.39197 Transcript_16666/m.39197 type:complete len:450 (-) Transcript_16666:462-1811(-)
MDEVLRIVEAIVHLPVKRSRHEQHRRAAQIERVELARHERLDRAQRAASEAEVLGRAKVGVGHHEVFRLADLQDVCEGVRHVARGATVVEHLAHGVVLREKEDVDRAGSDTVVFLLGPARGRSRVRGLDRSLGLLAQDLGAAERVDVLHVDQALSEHLADQKQALGPHEGQVLVSNAVLGPRVGSLGVELVHLQHVDLGQQDLALHVDAADFNQLLAVLGRLLEVATEDGVEVEVGEEERPLALRVGELCELPGLVVEATDLLVGALMAVTEEALAPVAALQLRDNLVADQFAASRRLLSERGKADDREERRVDLLGSGFAGEGAAEGEATTSNLVVSDVDGGAESALAAKEIHVVNGLECGLGHTEGGGVDLGHAVVHFVAALPDTVVRSPVRELDVVHKVLNELDFLLGAANAHAAGSDLSKEEQEERRGVELQVTPFIVSHDGVAG